MRINTNVAALNSYNQLKNTQNNLSQSLERLSSGKRINSAADDAAGLAISEKMNSQTRGLAQAQRNAQDGISMIQTAEGALKESHSILQRMRELSVQAANDTATDDDRAEINAEVDQLKSELDRIGNTTEFNTKTLLNGEQNQQTELGATNGANIKDASITKSMVEDTYTLTTVNADETTTDVNGSGTGLNDSTAVTLGTTSNDGFTVGEKYSIEVADATNGTSTSRNLTLKDSDGAIVATVENVDTTTTGTTAFNTSSGDTVEVDNTALNGNSNGTATFTIGETADYTLKDSGSNTIANKTGEVTTDGTIDISGMSIDVDNTLSDGDTNITVSGNGVQLQIGANENQTASLTIGDMRANSLKISEVDISTQDGAESAISTIDDAIAKVSSERSKLGSVQNRLDHTINNLNTAQENLTAAESRISDVDMAKEMMNMSKQQILSQAGTAMMAQANQLPQGVLQLLG